MKIKVSLCAAGFLLAASSLLSAASVTVSLGQSAQNFTMTGLGANGQNDGTYSIQQGTCSASGGTTTCTLSGSILSSTNANYGTGTYSFVTTFATADVRPVQGQSITPNSNLFEYDFLASDVTMVLDLHTGSGDYAETLSTGGGFPTGAGFGFTYVGTEACTGIATCTQAAVGYVNGATITGPVTMSATFNIPDQTTAPEPTSLALMGLTALSAAAYRLRKR